MKILCIVIGSLIACNLPAKTFSIVTSVEVVNGADKHYAGLMPGDTLMLEPGPRGPIQFNNLCGSTSHYLVIMNGNGLAEIKSATRPYGISIRNCRYIRLSGNGAANELYGIKISSVEPTGAGMGISDNTDNIEVSNIEIANINGPGILCKTEAGCVAVTYTLHNFVIHNTYVHHTGTEGMYIGSSAFKGIATKCGDSIKMLIPPMLQEVLVYDNLVEYTGWDGIQISDALYVKCYGNKIYYDSRKKEEWQNSGMVIGGGTTGKFYDNTIAHGYGYGITCLGEGTIEIWNNHILMDSALNKPAIYANDKLADADGHYQIKGNNLSTEFLPAIKIVTRKHTEPDEIIHNKIITHNKAERISTEGLKPVLK